MDQHFLLPADDYLSSYAGTIAINDVRQIRAARQPSLFDRRVEPYAAAVRSVHPIRSSYLDLSNGVVKIGKKEELTAEQQALVRDALHQFRPWKKGPFEFFGIHVDAEWRSDWKWMRILPHIQPLEGRRVADIGCHNGYFMLRMADQMPEIVVGFEPVPKHFWNFQLIQNWAQLPNLHFELLGVEHTDLFPNFFHTIFCLGILYHHTDPVNMLRKLHAALLPRGEIIVDCQGIPGSDPVALVPQSRYANARGIWFLPTQSCLEHWMKRAGFRNLKCFYAEPLSPREQRRTAWADVDSLAEFLDPNDSSRTIEGYPAPWRYYVRAGK